MIEWNKVTWYSKLVAIIFFIAVLPVLSFNVGVQYEKVNENNLSISIPIISPTPTTDKELKKYINEKYGFSFMYPLDYKIIESSRAAMEYMPAHDQVIAGYKTDLEDKKRLEGPPTFSVYVFANPQKLSPLEWIKTNDPGRNFELREISEGNNGYTFEKFFGVNALTYKGDGLYLYKYLAFNKDSHIYWIALASSPTGNLDPILEIHNKILNSFTLEK